MFSCWNSSRSSFPLFGGNVFMLDFIMKILSAFLRQGFYTRLHHAYHFLPFWGNVFMLDFITRILATFFEAIILYWTSWQRYLLPLRATKIRHPNASLGGLIVSSVGLHTTLPEGLKLLSLREILPEGLSVSSGKIRIRNHAQEAQPISNLRDLNTSLV